MNGHQLEVCGASIKMVKLIKIFFAFLVAFLVSGYISFLRFGRPEEIAVNRIPITPTPTIKPGDRLLAELVTKALDGTTGKYGVFIKGLNSGDHFYLNEQRLFVPGSLYKLWVMGAVFEQLENGKLDESEVLTGDVAEINNRYGIASKEAELKDGVITLSVKDALNQMITISHNYAAIMLTEKIGRDTIIEFLAKQGFEQSRIGDDISTSALDVGRFFEKLYGGQLANAEDTARMLDLLKAQTLNNKLPIGLPTDVVIAHKTGELDRFTHDAGIVYTPKENYIVVVLTESDSPTGAEERIAEISKAAYKYFTDTLKH